jgi:hypothetical protein
VKIVAGHRRVSGGNGALRCDSPAANRPCFGSRRPLSSGVGVEERTYHQEERRGELDVRLDEPVHAFLELGTVAGGACTRLIGVI